MVVEIEYLTDADQVEKVYLEVGHDSGIKTRVIDPAVQTAMKSITLQFTTEQFLTEHAMIENQLLEIMTEQLQQFNIITDGFYILGTERSTTGLPQPTAIRRDKSDINHFLYCDFHSKLTPPVYNA